MGNLQTFMGNLQMKSDTEKNNNVFFHTLRSTKLVHTSGELKQDLWQMD